MRERKRERGREREKEGEKDGEIVVGRDYYINNIIPVILLLTDFSYNGFNL